MTFPRGFINCASVPLFLALTVGLLRCSAHEPGKGVFTFCCRADNDLFCAVKSRKSARFGSIDEALTHAPEGSALLMLADDYPTRTILAPPSIFQRARNKRLHLFVEYADRIPGLRALPVKTTEWERVVVASGRFSPALRPLQIVAAHDCHFLPYPDVRGADLVVARVAGYDNAIFGLPATNLIYPILFQMEDNQTVVASTCLSCFVRARFAPLKSWEAIWTGILSMLQPGSAFELHVTPVVTPAFPALAGLPRKFERSAFLHGAHWFSHAHLLVNEQEKNILYKALTANEAETSPADANNPEGDGSLGILEGYSSGIKFDGQQNRRLPLRADCNAESAMVLAMDGKVGKHNDSSRIAENLLDFVYFNSGMCAGARANPKDPAFGLIGWGDLSPAWLVANYGDDNARTILATILAGTSLNTNRWDERIMRALLANLRTTGKLGFRGDRLDLPSLEANGWRHFHESGGVNYSPHFESYLWACYLWAYRQTGYTPFLGRARTAIEMTMKVYPGQWRWQDNLERAHMLLCLSWLVRVDDSPAHREWLDRVLNDLVADQQPSGAIHERLGIVVGGHYRTPQKNEDYGTAETPLLQQNGDPVSDQLYTTGFALLGLHEAFAATGKKEFLLSENRLAEYLCRIQTRSQLRPWLNGTWFRAFDDRAWEAWASSADVGWGAWSIESGWGQAWIVATLGLRQMNTSFWDVTAGNRVKDHFIQQKSLLEIPD